MDHGRESRNLPRRRVTRLSRRLGFLLYGGIAYWSFVMAILYLVGFVGNILVPRSIDVGPEVPAALAATIDLALIVLFAVQHSVMARPGFKKWWTNKIPEPIERSTFVFFTTSVFGLMFWFWRPIPVIVWHVDEQTAALALPCSCRLHHPLETRTSGPAGL